MNSKQNLWTESYQVASYLVNFQKSLSLYGLLSLLQETAWRHADHLGHGYSATQSVGTSWVLVKQRVEMERFPTWGERLQIRTWLRPPSTVIVTRDFELFVGEERVGQAAAHWLTIDSQTRRPTALPFRNEPGIFRTDGHLSCEPKKLFPQDDLVTLATFPVQNSDLDMNGHVNNTRFSQWITDSLSLDTHRSRKLKSYEINFLAEVLRSDEVEIQGLPSGSPPSEDGFPFQGRRAADQTVLFTARLQPL